LRLGKKKEAGKLKVKKQKRQSQKKDLVKKKKREHSNKRFLIQMKTII
jgi:hypothetical protein